MMKSKSYSTNKNLSEKEEILVKKLISVWKDKEFVSGIIFTLKNDKEVQEMIDFFDTEGKKTPSELTTKALLIANERNSNFVEDDFFKDLKNLADSIK